MYLRFKYIDFELIRDIIFAVLLGIKATTIPISITIAIRPSSVVTNELNPMIEMVTMIKKKESWKLRKTRPSVSKKPLLLFSTYYTKAEVVKASDVINSMILSNSLLISDSICLSSLDKARILKISSILANIT